MRTMRAAAAAASLTLLTLSTGCVIYPIRVEIEDSRTIAFEGVKSVDVDTRNGAIELRCDPARKDIAVRSIRSARGMSDADAKQQAELIELQIAERADDTGALRIAAKMPSMDAMRSYCARFEIVMPPKAAMRLHTSNGRITAAGARDNVRAETSNGRIIVNDCQGNLVARTSNGCIEARDVAGDLDVQSSNGDLELLRAGKNEIRAVTSNGRIRALDCSGAASMCSTNGSIDLHCRSVPPSPQIDVVTSNGHVNLELPNTVSGALEMNTSNGRVHADLKGTQISDFESGRTSLRAKLNDGSGRIGVRSSNGSVTLRLTDAPPTVRQTSTNS